MRGRDARVYGKGDFIRALTRRSTEDRGLSTEDWGLRTED
jgi:hypothetical protein